MDGFTKAPTGTGAGVPYNFAYAQNGNMVYVSCGDASAEVLNPTSVYFITGEGESDFVEGTVNAMDGAQFNVTAAGIDYANGEYTVVFTWKIGGVDYKLVANHPANHGASNLVVAD